MFQTSLVILIILLTSLNLWAQSSFEKYGIPLLKKSVLESFVETEQGKRCPAAGSRSFDRLAESSGSAGSSADSIARLLEVISGSQEQLNVDSSRCSRCQQINQVAAYTTSVPSKTLENASCDNRPTVNIRKILPRDQIQDFAENTLRGRTPEGQSLYQGCPDPCSFYVASATTERDRQQSLLNLTVHCGQPRKGSILFAKYNYTAGLIQSWTCK